MKKLIRHSIIVMVLVILVISAMIAGNPTRTGSSGASELLIPVGARGVALGESSLMSAVGVDAIYWNPAGLSRGTHGAEAGPHAKTDHQGVLRRPRHVSKRQVGNVLGDWS